MAQKEGNPQLDEGYTRIANELLEALLTFDLTLRELKVALCIARVTYGWNKKESQLPNRYLASMTNLAESHVSQAIKSLLEKGVIRRVMRGRRSQTLGIQKHYKEWKQPPVTELVSRSSYRIGKSKLPNRSVRVTESVSPTGTDILQDKGSMDRKDIFKDIKDNPPLISPHKGGNGEDLIDELRECLGYELTEFLSELSPPSSLLVTLKNVAEVKPEWMIEFLRNVEERIVTGEIHSPILYLEEAMKRSGTFDRGVFRTGGECHNCEKFIEPLPKGGLCPNCQDLSDSELKTQTCRACKKTMAIRYFLESTDFCLKCAGEF